MNIEILEAKDMLRTNEEKELLRKLADGSLDGLVGSPLITSGGSTIWSVIENGIPTRYKRGPGGKIFNVVIPFSKPFESPENGTALSIK